MKKILTIIGIAAATLAGANAAVLVDWSFNGLAGGTNNFGPSPFAPTASDSNLTVGSLTRGSGIGTTGSGASNGWGGNDFIIASPTFAAAVTANEFATFTFAANTGYEVSFTSINAYNIRRSGTGPTTGQWQYQIGVGAFTDIGSNITWGATTSATGNAQSAITLSGFSNLQNIAAGTTVTFRLVTWGATGTGGTWYFNDQSATTTTDLIVNGTVAAVPEPKTWGLIGIGSAFMLWNLRRRREIQG